MSKNYLLPMKAIAKINDKSITSIGTVIFDLLENGSPMTPEVLEHRITPLIGEKNTELFLNACRDSKVPAAQTRELHNTLLKDFIDGEASERLKWLQDNIKKPGAVDQAMTYMRELKSMQPVQHVSLGKQTAAAMDLTFNGAKALVRYGYPYLDHHLGGMTRGEVTVLAGRPSHGKTTLAIQLTQNMIRAGLKVIVFSLEMPTTRLIQKMLSNRANIMGHKIRQGTLDVEEKQRMTEAAEEFTLAFRDQLLIYDDVYQLNEMETIIAKHKPDVVVLDFIQLLSMESNAVRFEINEAMKRFKRMAKEYDMAPLILSQLNRNIENREDPRPRNSDLAESGSLEQLAGTILMIWYEFILDNTKSQQRVEIIASKTRYGQLATFPMGFDGSFGRYYQLNQHRRHRIDLEENIERAREEAGGEADEETDDIQSDN